MGNKLPKSNKSLKTKPESESNITSATNNHNPIENSNISNNLKNTNENNNKNFKNNLMKNDHPEFKTEKITRSNFPTLNIVNNPKQNFQSDQMPHGAPILQANGGSLYQDIRKIYKFKDVLGGGHFGTVRIGFKKSEEPRKFYAIKSISKKNLTEKDLQDLIREVEIISNLDHPNIIKFFETYHDEYYFHIVMELCKGKEVFDKIIEEESITEIKVAKIVYNVLSAIHYCHTNGISHRDIKPENILFESSDLDADIKLIDFGLSRKYNSNEKMHTILGTPYYVAPEVLKGDYDQKCDLWSLGAITYIMLCGEPPFSGKTNNEIFKKIINEEISFEKGKWKNVSIEAKNFIKDCMTKNPEKRITAIQAFEHPWFSSINEEVHSSYLDKEILNNIKNFSSPQKFKKLVLKFMINFLSQKETKDLKKAFYAIDYDHTGKINIDELEKAFNHVNINVSQDELKKIIEYSDDHGNGRIEYTDFIVASINQKKFLDKDRLILAFKYFDVDDSGFIDDSDVKKAMLRSGKNIIHDEDVQKMLEEVTSIDFPKISMGDFLKLFDIQE